MLNIIFYSFFQEAENKIIKSRSSGYVLCSVLVVNENDDVSYSYDCVITVFPPGHDMTLEVYSSVTRWQHHGI